MELVLNKVNANRLDVDEEARGHVYCEDEWRNSQV